MFLEPLFFVLGNYWTIEQAEERVAIDGSVLFIHSRRIKYLYFGLIGVIYSCSSFIIYALTGGDQEFYVYAACVLCASIYCIIKYRKRRSLVLEPRTASYQIYLGHKLVYFGPYHNIYIRMIKKEAGLAQFKYYLVIDGCGFVAPIVFSRFTRNTKRLRQLAMRLAQVIGINYFDVPDFSHRHYIQNSHQMTPQHGESDWPEERAWHQKRASQDTTLSSIASMLRTTISRQYYQQYES